MREDRKCPVWIWYPGDFEIYHGMLQNFQREERGYGWPAYWKMDDWRKNVRFFRTYELEKPTEFQVTGQGVGYVSVNGKKYPLGQRIPCEAGTCAVEIFIGNMTGLPCVYVEGEVIRSDRQWMADDFTEAHPVGVSSLYTEKGKNPNKIYYEQTRHLPVSERAVNGGVLFDFGRMINGTLNLTFQNPRRTVTVAYGESDQEALDLDWCYYKQENVGPYTLLRRRAFRYIYLPECEPGEISCEGVHTYIPIETRAEFYCDNARLEKIWHVAAESYELCSGLFFIDGIKRDRWIWSGDAYQSYFVNPYLFFDEEIDKRTILALRGNEKIVQHINTIVDYSMLWLISIEKEYWITGDREFVEMIYPKMEGMMQLLESQRNETGFLLGRPQDWIFVDWADIDKDGAVCAEQILLLKCYETMAFCGDLIGKEVSGYRETFARLKAAVLRYFWKEEKGAFIDCYESGRNHVSRHANIFAILFDLVTEKQKEQILEHVLLNPEVPQITTPYFKFFELDVWGKTGHLDRLMDSIQEYWGSMVDAGAVTFWEEFDPKRKAEEQYSMYSDPYGKSLCHAWGASPIYLLGRYFLGVRPLTPGYETFEAEPRTEFFHELDCVVPVKDGEVRILYKHEKLSVTASREGGFRGDGTPLIKVK